MTYMLLIYTREATTDAAEHYLRGLADSGELVGGQALADPVTARTVRIRDGAPVVSDGPFVDSQDYLAGTLVLECETEERATEIALNWPDDRFVALELRPVMDESGMEM